MPDLNTAFPMARFVRAGTSSGAIAALQAAWALLSPAVQDAENTIIEGLSDLQVLAISSFPVSGGAVPVPQAPSGQLIVVQEGGGASSLVPTAVKTANYTAAASDFVPCDVSGGGFTVTLPSAPADKTQIGIKIIGQASTPNALTIARGGTDVFDKAGGATSLTVNLLFQDVIVEYAASSGIWYSISSYNALGQLDSRYAPTIQGAAGTNFGATQTIDFQNTAREIWLVGTANTDLTVTLANRVAGCRARILDTQDGTGGHGLVITDGVTPVNVVPTQTAGALTYLDVVCPDSTTVNTSVERNSPSAQIFNASGTYTIPAGATLLEVLAVGGGGGGGGAGSAAATQLQVGAGGGGAGGYTQQIVSVGANTSLAVTIGAGGTNGTGGAPGGNAGSQGTRGGDTTVTGTGISVIGMGGSQGLGTGASSTAATVGGIMGSIGTGTGGQGGATISEPGGGGASGIRGGGPLGYSGGGGAGGTAATTTLGGGGGTAGTPTGGGVLGSASATSAGTNANSALANTAAGGGGGGGGAAGTGAGGNGGAGGSGYAVIKVIG